MGYDIDGVGNRALVAEGQTHRKPLLSDPVKAGCDVTSHHPRFGRFSRLVRSGWGGFLSFLETCFLIVVLPIMFLGTLLLIAGMCVSDFFYRILKKL